MRDMEGKGSETAVLDYLRRLCSMREYSRKDVFEKAQKRLDDPSAAQRIADSLEKEGYIDELRYASAFARDKASIRGWGPYKIRMALSSKGIASETIASALAAIDSDKADEKLRKALEAKYRQLKGDPQLKIKLLRFGQGRGYDYETVSSVLESLLADD